MNRVISTFLSIISPEFAIALTSQFPFIIIRFSSIIFQIFAKIYLFKSCSIEGREELVRIVEFCLLIMDNDVK